MRAAARSSPGAPARFRIASCRHMPAPEPRGGVFTSLDQTRRPSRIRVSAGELTCCRQPFGSVATSPGEFGPRKGRANAKSVIFRGIGRGARHRAQLAWRSGQASLRAPLPPACPGAPRAARAGGPPPGRRRWAQCSATLRQRRAPAAVVRSSAGELARRRLQPGGAGASPGGFGPRRGQPIAKLGTVRE